MAHAIPQYIEDRIRRPAPVDSCIVMGSTPVVAFGNARNARVATLGLNPSRSEFLDDDSVLLEGEQRRLATHTSLGVSDLAHAPVASVARVLQDCDSYFHGRPYWRWFKQFEPTLSACNASYSDESACHLDLVQWATDPIWGKLRPAALRHKLIADDTKFLAEQLNCENLRLLLVNGAGVLRELLRAMGDRMEFVEMKRIDGFANRPTRLFAGRIFDRVQVVAWSTNLQSSFGVTAELREELPKRIAAVTK